MIEAMLAMAVTFYVLLLSVSLSEANYDFTIRFYEFRNPLGLQCGECGTSGGLPACCDDVQRRDNCNMTRPFTCDTRFRFLLRPFGSSVETAPDTGFPYFTRSNGNNSDTFNEGPGGLLTLPNPFNISSTMPWPGRVQFFIDAQDRAVNVNTSGINETQVIINRFPIDLELDPGTNFTERTTYTGIYNISGQGFDMSFRVQCTDNFFGPNCCPEENYFGPNCTIFCKPVEGVYTCDSEGGVVYIQADQDPATFYTTTPYTPSDVLVTSACSERDTSFDVIAQASLGSALGLSVIVNICLLITVVVLLVKLKSHHYSKRPSMEKEDEAMDIELKPNLLYGLTRQQDASTKERGQDTMEESNYEYVIP